MYDPCPLDPDWTDAAYPDVPESEIERIEAAVRAGAARVIAAARAQAATGSDAVEAPSVSPVGGGERILIVDSIDEF